jgi:preprotein translocase subunit SecD
MYKNLRWKFLTILAVTALAVFAFWPPWTKVRRGLDLQGGVHLALQVKTEDAVNLETETAADQLRSALKTANVAVGNVHPTGLDTFVVEGVTPAGDAQLRTIADQQVGQSFDRDSVAGTYTFTMKPNVLVNTKAEAVRQAIQTIERRVNEMGVSEPTVAPYGTRGDAIVVELPGVKNVAQAKDVIKSTAFLSLHIVQGGPAADQAALLAATGGKKPDDADVVPGDSGDPTGQAGQVYYLLQHTPVITGRDLQNARPGIDSYNRPNIRFTLKGEGASKFGTATSANIGRSLAIVLDGHVVSAPRIDGRIDSDGEITGRFTQQEAETLSLTLRSGALPATLTYMEQNEVGPSLGQDSIRAGIIASVTGLGLVTVFMLLYYRLAGINAFVSVALNLVILLGCMAYIGAVMTLPGIAGFILTIGMGVDSNVLIFERIREELATNKGVRQALAAGFDRVFITIVDTHISSLIAAAFLFQFGTGPIRGFATTLFFGLIANVFTAVFVSRTLFEFILSRKPAGVAKLSI